MPFPAGALPDWARAHGPALFSATIRREIRDFVVTEQLPIAFDDSGEHDYLKVRKTGANTSWVARQLARHAGVGVAGVGYAGMKDRRSISEQWFSVPRRSGGADWGKFRCDGVELLDVRRHSRKLRRGAHSSNSFRIALRSAEQVCDRSGDRLQRIAAQGVPNYFGPQRFGRDGSNLQLAMRVFDGKRLRRDKRSIAISAARSYLFNEILSRRVDAGTWNRILPGERANLDGSGSVFDVAEPDADIERRCVAMDIHPTATMYGASSSGSSGDAADVERDVIAAHRDIADGLEGLGVKSARRALRLPVRDLVWRQEADALWLEFTLPRGGFATAVLREIAASGR